MLNLSTENKDLCFKDSTQKPLYIFLYYWQNDREYYGDGYWQYFKTIDEAILLESMELDEGVLEGNTFELGSMVIPTMKVQWYNDGITYKDMIAVPVQKIGNQYVAYFDGFISKEEISEDGQTVTVEITSPLTERVNTDVSFALNELNGWSFEDMVYTILSSTAGISNNLADYAGTSFSNLKTTINFGEGQIPTSFTAGELIKQAGEFLGAHIILKEKRIVDFEEMKSYKPLGTPIINFVRLSNVDTVAKAEIEKLPDEYKRLEYIEGTGTQYTATDIYPDDTTTIEIKFSASQAKTPHAIVGFNNGATDAFWFFVSGNQMVLDYGSGAGYNRISGGSLFENRVYDFEIGNRYVKNLDTKETILSSSQVSFPQKTTPIYIFGASDHFIGKIYGCKIMKSYNLVADLVPCIRLSDNSAGFYDLISQKFYGNSGTGWFLSPTAISTYELPYYKKIYVDKTKPLKIDQLRVLTNVGTQRNYTVYWNTNSYNVYEISNNIFFEALSAESWEKCSSAVNALVPYMKEQKFYNCDLQSVYPLFIEGGDYLLLKTKSNLPDGYIPINGIKLGNLNTGIFVDGSFFEFDVEFEIGEQGNSTIFSAYPNVQSDTVFLRTHNNGILCLMGYYGGSTLLPDPMFEIPYCPKNQKIKLNIKRGNGKCVYSGTFNGITEYGQFWADGLSTDTPIKLGGDCKIYHFAYSQDGVKLLDLYPCIRENDKTLGMYNMINGEFIESYGLGNFPKYETTQTVVPILSCNSKGIHSISSTILCQATNNKK